MGRQDTRVDKNGEMKTWGERVKKALRKDRRVGYRAELRTRQKGGK